MWPMVKGTNTVSVIDTNTNMVITTIYLPTETGPFDFAYDPINDEIYVTDFNGNDVFRINASQPSSSNT